MLDITMLIGPPFSSLTNLEGCGLNQSGSSPYKVVEQWDHQSSPWSGGMLPSRLWKSLFSRISYTAWSYHWTLIPKYNYILRAKKVFHFPKRRASCSVDFPNLFYFAPHSQRVEEERSQDRIAIIYDVRLCNAVQKFSEALVLSFKLLHYCRIHQRRESNDFYQLLFTLKVIVESTLAAPALLTISSTVVLS